MIHCKGRMPSATVRTMTATSVNQRRTRTMAEKHAAKKKDGQSEAAKKEQPRAAAPDDAATVRQHRRTTSRVRSAEERLDVIENALEQELNIELNTARERLGFDLDE
jgi:hypothetical protein